MEAPIPPLPELELVGVARLRGVLETPRLSYMQAGDPAAPAVVLLHGIGSNATGWRFVLDGMKAAHRVVAWNAPGYYLSEPFRAASPRIEDYADALAALLDELEIGTTCVAGSSFGSLVAVVFAARHPHRVGRLALLGASRGQRHLPGEERARRLAMRAESVRDSGGVGLADTRWRNLLGPSASPRVIALTKAVLRATNPGGLLQAARASDAADAMDHTPRIAAPTLLVVGTEDQVNPAAVSRTVGGSIAGSRLVELEGIGHLPKLEAPARTVELLAEHFAPG